MSGVSKYVQNGQCLSQSIDTSRNMISIDHRRGAIGSISYNSSGFDYRGDRCFKMIDNYYQEPSRQL